MYTASIVFISYQVIILKIAIFFKINVTFFRSFFIRFIPDVKSIKINTKLSKGLNQMITQDFQYQKALPVWEKGKSTIMNHTLEFISKLQDAKDYRLYISGSSSYLIFVNNTFVAHGPARAAHGFYKVDCVPLKELLSEGENTVTIRCTGYNANSFCYLDTPSFLCAEVTLDNKVITATGYDFDAFTYPAKIQRTQRYSYQRTFAEIYHLSNEIGTIVELENVSDKKFVKRDVPYCEYQPLLPTKAFRRGTFSSSEKEHYFDDREITDISPTYKGYYENELDCGSYIEYGKLDFSEPTPCDLDSHLLALNANEYVDIDMGTNQTGLFTFDIEAKEAGTLFLAFDELLIEETLNPFRNYSSNIILLHLEPGDYHFVSAEPYTLKYARLAAKDSAITVKKFSMIEIAFPESKIHTKFEADDETMRRIFDAAILSFRANVVDIYMDCPSRERAGWLCDSFFTARVEKLLTGDSIVEKSFLESFLLPDSFPNLPDGMLPMCYPADVLNEEYIPNWAMWYALELYEYYERTGDNALVEAARPRMEQLLSFIQGYENSMGLLENLGGIVFVDASRSNKLAWEHGISFPTNMLYAAFKSVLGILYNRPDFIDAATALRDLIRHYAVAESGFFRDCADYTENGLVVCNECTEAGQYYAFFFRIATPESHPMLWKTLIEDFGYDRAETKKYPDIAPANAFIGNYLRLDLLEQYGYKKELYDNILGYFSYMAEETGTLWEYVTARGSCNHGYASHVIYWMNKLGLLS